MELNLKEMLYIYRSRTYKMARLNYVLAIFQTSFHANMTLQSVLRRWKKFKFKIIFQI